MPRRQFDHVKFDLTLPANISVSALLGSICVRILLLLLEICWSIQTVIIVFIWVHPFQNASWGSKYFLLAGNPSLVSLRL